MNKNNIFLFSPGGYGPYSRIQFWADHVDYDLYDDAWADAADEYIETQDKDYGCYYMTREDAERLVKTLRELLDE